MDSDSSVDSVDGRLMLHWSASTVGATSSFGGMNVATQTIRGYLSCTYLKYAGSLWSAMIWRGRCLPRLHFYFHQLSFATWVWPTA